MVKEITLKVLIIAYLSLMPQIVYAISPPNLINPIDNSIVSSSKLTWDSPGYTLYSSDPYRIQVDDNSDFSSTFRDYTTKNNYYTPSLNEGKWYWRIKSKDSGGTWSDWSSVWSFTYNINPTTPEPTANQTPTSTSTPNPSSTSNPTSSFILSNVPSNINSDQSFEVSIDLSLPQSSNSIYYLKGAFKKSDSSNYFGLTKVGSSIWIANGSNYSSQYSITTDSSGTWIGKIDVKVDPEDSGFTGSGQYLFKVGRYSNSGGGPIWSNEVSMNITNVETKSTSSTPTTKPKSTDIPSKKSSVLGSSVVYPNKPKINLASSGSVLSEASRSSELSSTESAAPASSFESLSDLKVEGNFQINPTIIIGLVFVLGGIGYLAFLKFKN